MTSTEGGRHRVDTRLTEAEQSMRRALHEGLREHEIQALIEANPELLVHRVSLSPRLLITQLPLGADYKPDFAFMHSSSAAHYVELVEIEPPSLQMFTAGDEFSSAFHHARQQVSDWRSWCRRNRDQLAELLKPAWHPREPPRDVDVRCRLYVGRREQLSNSRRTERWQEASRELPRSVTMRTLDGLLEDFASRLREGPLQGDAIPCVRYRRGGFAE